MVFIPPDGSEILAAQVYGGTLTVTVYDSQDLSQTDQFQIATPGVGTIEFLLSYDGGTLYGTDVDYGPTLACDWKTGRITGWLTSFALQPMATDPSGLLVGSAGEGVGFLDGTVSQAVEPQFGTLGTPKSVRARYRTGAGRNGDGGQCAHHGEFGGGLFRRTGGDRRFEIFTRLDRHFAPRIQPRPRGRCSRHHGWEPLHGAGRV